MARRGRQEVRRSPSPGPSSRSSHLAPVVPPAHLGRRPVLPPAGGARHVRRPSDKQLVVARCAPLPRGCGGPRMPGRAGWRAAAAPQGVRPAPPGRVPGAPHVCLGLASGHVCWCRVNVKPPAAGQPRPGRPAGWARCVVRPPPVRTCGALLAGADCAPTVLVVQSKTLSTPPPPPAAHPRISTRCDATRALAPPQRAGGGAAPALPRSGRASPDADSPPPPDLSRWRRGTTPPPSSGATLHARTCVLRSVILPPGREPGTMRTAQSERSWTASCTCCARRCACAPCSVPAAAQRTHTHRCVRASTGE